MHHLVRRCTVCACLYMCGVPLLFPRRQRTGDSDTELLLEPQWISRLSLPFISGWTDPMRHVSLERCSKYEFQLPVWLVGFSGGCEIVSRLWACCAGGGAGLKTWERCWGYWIISGIWANCDRRQAPDWCQTGLGKKKAIKKNQTKPKSRPRKTKRV